jgi:anti-anti-sigma factor
MLAPSLVPRSGVAISPQARPLRATYVVDLIGDLDADLAQSFADSTEQLGPIAGERIVVHTRHVAEVRSTGVAVLGSAVEALRSVGCDVAVVAENKRIRSLLRAGKVETAIGYGASRSASVRHIMIVRNSDPSRDCA